MHPTTLAGLHPPAASLIAGIQARCGRRRTYPTLAMANEYDRGWCADDAHGIEPGSPAHDGLLDQEADLQARDDERREAHEAWLYDQWDGRRAERDVPGYDE